MLRTSALFAFLTALIDLIMLVWDGISSGPVGTTGPYGGNTGVIVGAVINLVMPVFYIALYYSPASLHLSDRLKRTSLAGALVAGLIFIADSNLSYLASMFLLLALYWQPDVERAEGIPPSRFFRRVTRITVVTQCVLLLVSVWLVWLIPRIYASTKKVAEMNNVPLTLGSMMEAFLLTLVGQVSVFAVPYVVSKSYYLAKDVKTLP